MSHENFIKQNLEDWPSIPVIGVRERLRMSLAPLEFARSRAIRAVVRRWSERLPVKQDAWTELRSELDRWQPAQARFWWRDDDTIAPTAALDRLLALAQQYHVPIALAVIPASVSTALPDVLKHQPDVCVLAHGWSHHNHAPAGSPLAELAPGRLVPEVYRELSDGRIRLENLFGRQFHPVQVPPHNIVAPSLVPTVAHAGFKFLSIDRDFTGLRLPSRNVHADLIDWDNNRALDSQLVVRHVVAALRLRRYGLVSASLPIGLLTHHLVHDEEIWATTETLLLHLTSHAAVSFPTPTDLFTL